MAPALSDDPKETTDLTPVKITHIAHVETREVGLILQHYTMKQPPGNVYIHECKSAFLHCHAETLPESRNSARVQKPCQSPETPSELAPSEQGETTGGSGAQGRCPWSLKYQSLIKK
jgi:hypothetical protein